MRKSALTLCLALLVGLFLPVTAMAGPFYHQKKPVIPLQEVTIRVDGQKRSYKYFIPAKRFAPDSNTRPLVIMLHGGGGDADSAAVMTGFSKKAKQEGFIIVYPEGSSRLLSLNTWNAGHCCAYSMKKDIDDVAFIDALIDDMVDNHGADPKRIYVTGMSNGAMLAHRIGRELGDKVTAIAPVVGAVFGDEPPPQKPVSTLIIVGADDLNVPGEGGNGKHAGRKPPNDKPYAPATAQLSYWARGNKCPGPSENYHTDDYVLTGFYNCENNTLVRYFLIRNNGHAWPGGEPGRPDADQPTWAFRATDVIWEFFEATSR